MKTLVFLFCAVLALLVAAVLVEADVTWYFNWYCSGCARIGARTTGTEGPFSSQGACESARSSMQSNMDRRGGGVRAESCYRTGFESAPPSQPSTGSVPQGRPSYSSPTYPQPQIDTGEQQRLEEERRRQQEEAERARQAEIERQRQEEFRRGRDEAVRSLRGGDSAPLGIRGNPTGALELRGLPERQPTTSGSSRFPVWQQLNCIHNIFKGLVEAAKDANKDEMEYLRQEIKNAMDSQPLGVSCAQAPPPPKPYGERELNQSKILSFYQTLADATVREGEKIQTWLTEASSSFLSRSAEAVAAAKREIIAAPHTSGSGSTTRGLLSEDYAKWVAEYEARKADVFRRLREQSKLRDECRAKLPACSTDGRAYDEREAIRRRDRQYFLWGEASYYIPWEIPRDRRTLGLTAIKTWPYGAETIYIWWKRDVMEYGSTPPGGHGAGRLGLQKAINDNESGNPSVNLGELQRQENQSNSAKIEATNRLNRYSQMSDQALANPGRAGELEQALTQRRN